MVIDWDRWQEIESCQNRYLKDVEFTRERLSDATLNLRDCEASLARTVRSSGQFRRVDVAGWMSDARTNPERVLAEHRDHPAYPLIAQFHQAIVAKRRAADAHSKAEAALHAHSGAYHQLRKWIHDQQSRGVL
jgi:hypothetical protein